jgi:type I restriction enzyme S subunit
MRTKNVQSSLDLSDVWGIPKELVKRPDQYLQEGDILVSSANSWNLIGKCCWVPPLAQKATFGGFVSVLRPSPKHIEPRYLFRWFSSEPVQTKLRSFGRQTTNISNLDLTRCAALEVPLPPIAEQRRIAAILDEADALRVKRRAALAHLDEMARAIFVEMFGDVVSNSKKWDSSRVLGDVADVASGITKGRKAPNAELRTVPYLAVANVQDHYLILDNVKHIEASDDEIERYRLRRDDLVLTEGGDPDKLGRGALWNDELPVCIHQNHIFRVRLTSPEIHPVFLNWLVGSPRGKTYFLRSAKQTTGIASINMTQLRGFPLLIPPMAIQAAFVAHLEELRTTRDAADGAATALDSLFASLQHRAFRGEM